MRHEGQDGNYEIGVSGKEYYTRENKRKWRKGIVFHDRERKRSGEKNRRNPRVRGAES